MQILTKKLIKLIRKGILFNKKCASVEKSCCRCGHEQKWVIKHLLSQLLTNLTHENSLEVLQFGTEDPLKLNIRPPLPLPPTFHDKPSGPGP